MRLQQIDARVGVKLIKARQKSPVLKNSTTSIPLVYQYAKRTLILGLLNCHSFLPKNPGNCSLPSSAEKSQSSLVVSYPRANCGSPGSASKL